MIIRAFGAQANFMVPLGVLGPFSQWLNNPEWLYNETSLRGARRLPQRISLKDDITILANTLDRGFGSFLLCKTLDSDRLITGPSVALIVRNAPSLNHAMAALAKALTATNPNLRAEFKVGSKWAEFVVHKTVDGGGLMDFVCAIRIILAARAIERFLLRDRSYIQDAIRITLSLRMSDFEDEQLRAALVGCELSSTRNALKFPASWVKVENPDHDRALWEIARQRVIAMERKATDRDLANRFRHRVTEILIRENRVPRLKELAAESGMNYRTVARRLSSLGIQFQSIVDEERRAIVLQQIGESSIPLQKIAKSAGFTNHSSFCRSFRTWFGDTPSGYRSALRGDRSLAH